MPLSWETSREVRKSWVWSKRVATPKTSGWSRTAIATSSRAVLPARSPIPLMQPSTWRAPARMPMRELAVARPRSLWQCTETVTSAMAGTCA